MHFLLVCMIIYCNPTIIAVYLNQSNAHLLEISMMVRVFANGPGDLGSIPGRVIPKTQKMILDASLLNTQYYKVEQSWERSSTFLYTLV